MGNVAPTNTSTNPTRTLVPQNNLAQEQDFYPFGNYSYEQCMCYRVEPSQALITQDQAPRQQYSASQPTDGSHLHQQGDCYFMNHQPKEHCHANHDNYDAIAQYQKQKKSY